MMKRPKKRSEANVSTNRRNKKRKAMDIED